MKYVTPRSTSIAVSVLSLVVILIMIITKGNLMLYDEHNFIPNIHSLQQLGLTKKFLLGMSGSPGPTYAVIHYLFIGLTHFNITYIRITNFALLLLLLFVIYLNARLLKATDPLIITANFIVIPIIWVSCGLALTEIPAMLCAAVSVYLLLECFTKDHKFITRLILIVLAGTFLSFAILGRTFFLMIILVIPAYLLIKFLLATFDNNLKKDGSNLLKHLPGNKQLLILGIIFLACSLYLPLKVFTIWHALAPPQDTKLVGANNLSLVPWFCILSFCYCGFITLILAPNWFVINRRLLIITIVISGIFLFINIYKGYFEFAPFLSAAVKFLSPGGFTIYQRVIPALVFLFAFHFILSSVIRLWENRSDTIFIFLGLTILFIAFSTIKVKAQFSSRYVAQIIPFFLLLFIGYERTNWQKVIRVSIAAALGFVSLYFYYIGS